MSDLFEKGHKTLLAQHTLVVTFYKTGEIKAIKGQLYLFGLINKTLSADKIQQYTSITAYKKIRAYLYFGKAQEAMQNKV